MGSKGNKQSKVDEATRQQQLQLEQQRLELEKQAAAQRTQELELLRQQSEQQTQAYQAQYSLMQQQKIDTESASKQYQDLLSNLTASNNAQTAAAIYDKQRQQLLSDEAARTIGVQTGLLSSSVSKRGALAEKKKQVATPSYTASESRSLLSGEGRNR